MGKYFIKANATTVSGETDTTDNTLNKVFVYEPTKNFVYVTITVLGYPVAAFEYSPERPLVNEGVIFNASDSNPNGGEITYHSWDFGDGATTGPTVRLVVTHAYMSPGTYIVTLTVEDSEGLTDTTQGFITVYMPPSVYTRIDLSNQWVSNGVAMGWHADDYSWSYTLPFDFPFYGVYYRTIYISSNGLITFTGPDSSPGNSIGDLSYRCAIAPAWDDWLTIDASYDIYIWQPDSDHIIIRWYVRFWGTSTVANFEVILGLNGEIQFNYGYNDGPVSSTVGISNGVGDILAEDVTNLNYTNSILFTPYIPEHDLEVVYLEAPVYLMPSQSSTLNATVYNRGLSNETDVTLHFIINGHTAHSEVISELLAGSYHTISYLWTPLTEGTYNVTAYATPVQDETIVANNRVTRFVTVARPLIQPVEGQWANYTITFTEKNEGIQMVILLNSTYSEYISPYQMNVRIWMKDASSTGSTMTGWLTLNIINRWVETGIWAGMWYPLWIETNVTVGSTVNILTSEGTVTGSRLVEVGNGLLVDSWELQVYYYGMNYIFLFDKVTGIVTKVEEEYSSFTCVWKLEATNILKLLSMEVNPESGNIGTQATVTGTDATPHGTIEIYWDKTLLGTTVADDDENFSYTLTVPSSTRGIHFIRAVDLATHKQGAAVFTILSSISAVTPSSGPVGTKVQVTGQGFEANEHVVLSFEDMRIAEVNVDENGNFTATFNIPLSQSGPQMIKVCYGNDSVQTTFTVTDVSPLDINIDVGAIYFKGETAEFYVQTVLKGTTVNATSITAIIHKPDGTIETLTIQQIATGLYKALYPIPANAPAGTYVLAIEANYLTDTIDSKGTSIKSFLLSYTLTSWNAKLIEVQGDIAIIKTDIREIKVSLSAINAKLVAIDETVATINSTIGLIQTDISAINTTISAVNGTLVTIQTDLGTIKGKITNIEGDIATIQTDLGTMKTTLQEWTGGTSSVTTSQGTFKIFALTTSTLVGSIEFSDNVIILTVSGELGTTGTTHIVIPKQLLSDINNIAVTIDDQQTVFTYTEQPEAYVLNIAYTHSTHTMKIYLAGLPPTLIPWTLYIIATTIIVFAAIASLTIYTLKIRKPRITKTK